MFTYHADVLKNNKTQNKSQPVIIDKVAENMFCLLNTKS